MPFLLLFRINRIQVSHQHHSGSAVSGTPEGTGDPQSADSPPGHAPPRSQALETVPPRAPRCEARQPDCAVKLFTATNLSRNFRASGRWRSIIDRNAANSSTCTNFVDCRQPIGCYRRPTDSSGFESAVERTLSSVSAILVNDPALCRLVERRRNLGKLRFRLIEFPCRDRRANLLLSRFERTDDAGIACAASDALARAFGCRFDVCHGVNWKLRMRKSSKIRGCCKCQRRDLNPRPRAYESPALPLSYSGKLFNVNV